MLPPPSDFPLSECTRLLSGAWTADVIWYLREGERCFTELQNDIEGISAKMLTARLRKLERDGVIQRLTKPTNPPTVWYVLTPAGNELGGALTKIVEIGQILKRVQAGLSRPCVDAPSAAGGISPEDNRTPS